MKAEEARAIAEQAVTAVITVNYGPEWEASGDGYQFARGALAGARAVLEAMGFAEEEV